MSPGGGGFGEVDENNSVENNKNKESIKLVKTSGSLNQYVLNQESV